MTATDPLHALARDLAWASHPRAQALWRSADPHLWEALNHNPVAFLAELDPAAQTPAWRAEMEALAAELAAAAAAPRLADSPKIAYFCMEYGIHESLPIYSGGLGMLAGDHLRSASDLGLDFIAVGIFWREGYFRQAIHAGRQAAGYATNDTNRLPIDPVYKPGTTERLVVTVPNGTRDVAAQAWSVKLGRITLYLLDTDIPGAPDEDRALSRRLYGGRAGDRIRQEVVLGIGGVRLLEALGIEREVFHMNEGHAAFLVFELWAQGLRKGQSPRAAFEAARKRCIFTTHTPVEAGHDRFDWHTADPVLGAWRHDLGLPIGSFMDLGRVRPSDVDEPLCMTVLGMRGSRAINGVSALHGEVTRKMWADLKLPITSITNGVHPTAWLAPETEALWDRFLIGWRDHFEDRAFWERAAHIPVEAMLATRDARRQRLLGELRQRFGRPVLDPTKTTIGFARRFAPYKRGNLIFHDTARLEQILDQGFQIVFAGKAHPADAGGQAIIADVLRFCRQPRFRDQIVFIPDYDMTIGRLLTGCTDIWLNNPRRPYEASGTSGQKAALNGNLNLSILDGWWPEAADGTNGWSIGAPTDRPDSEEFDGEDAEALYTTLEQEVLPATKDPADWARRMGRAMATCAPVFNTHRMVRDYLDTMYRTPSKT